jgi:hypothetical protein
LKAKRAAAEPPSPEDRTSASRDALLKFASPAATLAISGGAQLRWDNAKPLGPGEVSILRQVLRAYDRDPANFREWLACCIENKRSPKIAADAATDCRP